MMIRRYGRVGVVLHVRRSLSSVTAIKEYTDKPNYPPIQDLSFEARRYRKKEILAEKMRKLATVEEKQMGLNMPKYHGFKCIMLNDHRFPYNSLPFVQYVTRTVFHETDDKLPDYYRKNDSQVDVLAAGLKSVIEDAILFEMEDFRQKHDLRKDDLTKMARVDLMSSALVKQIHRVIASGVSKEVPHLAEADCDIDPNHEAFWLVGGIEPMTVVQQIRDGEEWQKKHKMDPVDRPFQYTGFIIKLTGLKEFFF